MNAARATANRGTILIADGDPSVLVIVKTILTNAGYRVLLAAGSEDAIRLAGQKHVRIDVALLDVRLPGMPGVQLAGKILSIRPGVRVLFMSGFRDDEFIRIKLLGRQAGFSREPSVGGDLLQAVQKAVGAQDAEASRAALACAAAQAW
jgi:two-component system cell cycle sensor histidine kinase/response regulator CckA